MKLKNFLKGTKNPAVAARKVIEGKLPKLYNILKKKKWNVNTDQLVDILNDLFKWNQIEFYNSHKFSKDLVLTASFNTIDSKGIDEFYDIDIGVSEKAGKYIRKFARNEKKNHFFDIMKNDFVYTIIEYLTHELRHYQQFIKYPSSPNTDLLSGFEYYSNPEEIDAHAQQAAVETLKKGTSTILKKFISLTEPEKGDDNYQSREKKKLRKRFLKKYSAAMQQYK